MRLPLNIANHPPEDFITIAHRGGVVGEGAHENSLLAIHRAIERGYDMVEIDIMPTADGFPVLVHGDWYERRATGWSKERRQWVRFFVSRSRAF